MVMEVRTFAAHATKFAAAVLSGGVRGSLLNAIFGLLAGIMIFVLAASQFQFSSGATRLMALLMLVLLGIICGGVIGFLRGMRQICRKTLVNSRFIDEACDKTIAEALVRARAVGEKAISTFKLQNLLRSEGEKCEVFSREITLKATKVVGVRRVLTELAKLPQRAMASCLDELSRQVSATNSSDSEVSRLLDELPDLLKRHVNIFIDKTIRRIFFRPLALAYSMSVAALGLVFVSVLLM